MSIALLRRLDGSAAALGAAFSPASVSSVNLFLPSNGDFFATDGTTPWTSGAVGRWNPGKVGTPYASNATGSQQPTKTATGLQTVDGTTVLNLSAAVVYTGDFTLWFSGRMDTTTSKWFPLCGGTGQSAGILTNYGAALYARSDTNQVLVAFATAGIAAGVQLIRVRRASGNVFVRATGSTEYAMGACAGDFTFNYVMQWVGQDVTANTANRTLSMVGASSSMGNGDADGTRIESWFTATDGVSL